MIRVVSATRMNEVNFRERSWLAKSLKHHARVEYSVAYSNERGLPEIYNEVIDDGANEDGIDSDILVFAHDDVSINDRHFVRKIEAALERFDVVGVAGCTHRAPKQAYWFSRDNKVRDIDGLSGSVRHPGGAEFYGPAPEECKLLDGLFLAVRAGRLIASGVRFDPQFAFHFYDLDFCRTCEAAGLTMGTWPIDVSHASAGAFRSAEWVAARDLYFKKWRD